MVWNCIFYWEDHYFHDSEIDGQQHHENNKNISYLLKFGNTTQNLKKNNEIKAPFVLLHWSTNSHWAAGFSELLWWHSWNQFIGWESKENSKALRWFWICTSSEYHAGELHRWRVSLGTKITKEADLGLKIGHSKALLKSEDVGQTLDLSIRGSWRELYRKLAYVFDMERAKMLNNALNQDEKLVCWKFCWMAFQAIYTKGGAYNQSQSKCWDGFKATLWIYLHRGRHLITWTEYLVWAESVF